MVRCKFITSDNQVCNCITLFNHVTCRFHSSILERERHHLSTPKWARKLIPTQDDSHYHFKVFPKDNYDYYDTEEAEPDWEPYSIFKSNEFTTVMSERNCRFMATVGRFRGYYCNQPNQSGSDFCCFHRSVVEVPDCITYPVPIWTQCILPTAEDATKSMFNFPWTKYDLNSLLFLNLVTAPVIATSKPQSEPKSEPKSEPQSEPKSEPKSELKSELQSMKQEGGTKGKEQVVCPMIRPRVVPRSVKKAKAMKKREYTKYYECPGECREPGCTCKTILIPIQVVDFEPRQNLYRELDHNYIVKESGGTVVIVGIFDDQHKKMRPLTTEEKDHAEEHQMTVV